MNGASGQIRLGKEVSLSDKGRVMRLTVHAYDSFANYHSTPDATADLILTVGQPQFHFTCLSKPVLRV